MESAQGLKCIWNSQMGGKPNSSSIIKYVDMALIALEIVYRKRGAVIEGLADRNGHRKKEVGKGKGFSWGGAKTKGEGRKYELTKIMFFHNDFLQLCLRKKRKITEFFPDTTVFYY